MYKRDLSGHVTQKSDISANANQSVEMLWRKSTEIGVENAIPEFID